MNDNPLIDPLTDRVYHTGNFYGEGHTSQELMVATTPTRLKPASLAQLQGNNPAIGAG